MEIKEEMVVLYDGSCELCKAEIDHLIRADPLRLFQFVDCSAEDFEPGRYGDPSVTRTSVMNSLHLRLNTGDWLTGVDAFGVIYGTLGFPVLSRLWSSKLTRPISMPLYRWVVRHRYGLSRLGAKRFMEAAFRLGIRQSSTAKCTTQKCDARTTKESSLARSAS